MDKVSNTFSELRDLLQSTFLGNGITDILLSSLIFFATYIIVRQLKRSVVSHFAKIAQESETKWDDIAIDVVKKTKTWFVFLIAVSIATLPLDLPDRQRQIVQNISIVALLIQSGIWINTIIMARLELYRVRQMKSDPAGVTTLNAVGFMSKIVLWTVVLLLALDNLGVNITALVAGLGVGGIAVALAVQNILGDLFASLSIVIDKPFAVGDFLIINEHLGSVENVGLKTTRLRSLSGEQLVFSNSDLLNSRIRNFGRMFERRVVFQIGVTYQTSRENLRKIPEILKSAIESQEKTRFDRSHFKEYGDFSLNFETVYYVLSPDYNQYMDIHEAINLFIHEKFENEDIEFAYPTQTLFVHAEGNRVEAGPS